MSFVIVFAIFTALLFALPFLTKRRLGVLGLALAAGAMLSQLWVGDVTPIVASTGVILVKPPLESVVAAAIILLPALLLLFGGPTYSSLTRRVIGSAAFALLAVTLLLQSLGSALVIDGIGRTVYDFIAAQQSVIITICLVLSLADLLLGKKGGGFGKSRDKH